MLTLDDVIPWLGKPLDEIRVEALFGLRGDRSADELDPGHHDDQRGYYSLPAFGVQCILNCNDVIDTIFFHLEGDEDISPYPWSLQNGLNSFSGRKDVLGLFGSPERSGRASADNSFSPGGWDRFKIPAGFLHFQYNGTGDRIVLITAMTPELARTGG